MSLRGTGGNGFVLPRIRAGKLILILACLVAASCARPAVDHGFTSPPPGPRTVLAPGDLLEVKFEYYPELADTARIRPDGLISLRRIGEVQAAGLTPQQLNDALINAYTAKIKRPDLTVLVREMAPMRVFVGGEVRAPGEVTFPADKSRVNVLQAVIAAGGFHNPSARQSKVLVVRYTPEGRQATMINLKDLAAEGEGSNDQFYLAENDVVYVTRLRIDKVNQWIDQHINDVIPYGLRYTQTEGKRNFGIVTGY